MNLEDIPTGPLEAAEQFFVHRYTLPLPGWKVRRVDGWHLDVEVLEMDHVDLWAATRAEPVANLTVPDVRRVRIRPQLARLVTLWPSGLEVVVRVGLGWSKEARLWVLFRDLVSAG